MRGAPAIDRISDLPDLLKHDILSRMDTREAVRTSVLSKKWRHEWIWLSCLSFNKRNLAVNSLKEAAIVADHEPRREQEISRRKEAFLHFMDQALLCRSTKGYLLQKLSLYVPFSGVEITSHVDLWLACALKCGVRKLHLFVSEDNYIYQMPESFFQHAFFLTRLKLTHCMLFLENPCLIRLCNLEELSLYIVHVDERTINGMINCGAIKKVRIVNCRGFNKLEVNGAPKLEKVEIVMDELQKVVIDAMNLQTFSFGRCYPLKEVNMNVATCKSIRHLHLHGIAITDDQLSFHLTKFQYLEGLCLISCDSLKTIRINAPNLKNLYVIYCYHLERAKIDAPNLESFMLYSDLPSLSLYAPRLTSAVISLRYIYNNFVWCVYLIKLLTQFNHSTTTLTLFDFPNMYMNFPIETRSIFGSPLWKVEHVVLPIMLPIEYCTHSLVEIIDSVLWISPHVHSITLLMHNVVIKFHFVYKELPDEEAKAVYGCCPAPIQCWKHSLKVVKIEGLLSVSAASQLKALFECSFTLERIEGLPLSVGSIP